MENVPWPLVAAIASASLAFIYAQITKRWDFVQQRRSVVIAISVEIVEASKSMGELKLSWDKLREIAADGENRPVIIITSDLRLLSRTHLENYHLPPEALISVTRFQNTIQDAYEFLEAMNNEKFERMSVAQRVVVVDTSRQLCDEVADRARTAYKALHTHFPARWFYGLPSEVEQEQLASDFTQRECLQQTLIT